jgi:3-dehydroquinate synthase
VSATVHVSAERFYDVVIGRDLLADLVPLTEGATRAAMIFQPSVHNVARRVGAVLERAGVDVVSVEVPDAEGSKTVEVAGRCWSALGNAGFTRNDVIIGIGGGAVTDLAGFIAATWLRGVRCVVIPTSVLAMVDAAIGGKTGINTREGKNLVGVFSSPVGVLCDVTTLTDLPRAEVVSGMAEVVKVGLTSDATIVADLLDRTGEALNLAGDLLPDLIRRAVQVKADVVGADFQEVGGADGAIGREVLNYGHTLGHAIELHEGYTWRHGNAVAVGLMFAGQLSYFGGRLDAAGVETHRAILDAVGLPRTYPREAWPSLLEAMSLDKKSRGRTLRFVVLDGLQSPTIWRAPEPELLVAAYDALSA